MGQTIKLKRSATPNAIPTDSQLELGELAINTNDGKVFIKKGDESIVDITALPAEAVCETLAVGTNAVSPDTNDGTLHVIGNGDTLNTGDLVVSGPSNNTALFFRTHQGASVRGAQIQQSQGALTISANKHNNGISLLQLASNTAPKSRIEFRGHEEDENNNVTQEASFAPEQDGFMDLGKTNQRYKKLHLKDGVVVDDTLVKPSYHYAIQLFSGYQNLVTTPIQLGPDFYLRNYDDKHYKRFVEYSSIVSYSGTTSTNDLFVRAILVVPSDSGDAVDIGSVESIASSGTYQVNMVIAGDVSHWFSEYSGMSPNSDGTGPFSSVMSAIYNPSTDKTTINAGIYGMTAPSVGDSIYVHPFDWENTGSEIYYNFQHDVDSEASMAYDVYNKIYLGNIDRIAAFRLKFYEQASSDVSNVQRVKVFQTDERA